MSTTTRASLNNPALLTWAREAAGYSLEEMADKLSRPPDVLRAWELGESQPTVRQLEHFARVAKRSVATLYLPHPPPEPALPKDYRSHRDGLPRVFSPAARLAFRELTNALDGWREVAALSGRPARMDLPLFDIRDATTSAVALRRSLSVPFEQQLGWRDEYAALDGWRDALFARGVLVQQFPIEVAELRGFSVIAGELGGIGVSSKDAPRGRIFSILHEAVHLCLRQPGVSADTIGRIPASARPEAHVERYCDSVAAAALLPDEEAAVSSALTEFEASFDVFTAQRLARRLKVSKYVMARKLLDAGRVPPAAYWAAMNEWLRADRSHGRTTGAGGPEYLRTVVSRRGKPFVEAVLDAMEGSLITAYEASKVLDINPRHLDQIKYHLA